MSETEVGKYREIDDKDETVEAVRLTKGNFRAVDGWLSEAEMTIVEDDNGDMYLLPYDFSEDDILSDEFRIDYGDWVVWNGDWFVRSDSCFREEYEPEE
ncbi:MAG: hypothetical protein LBW85_01360 [Deltaproteobacteria bacterium]|jgi:hypothetical protein|nr:hypothetical protein [Deltaproteobacteria bacterium]